MAASPETAEPPELHPTQESPSLTTTAPLSMANPNYATPVPLPPSEQSTVEHTKADEVPPTPIDDDFEDIVFVPSSEGGARSIMCF